MPEVPYNQALNTEFYGLGVITNTSKPNLDMEPMSMLKGGIPCEKEPIGYPPLEKVNKNFTNNYEDYLNESINKLNFMDRSEDRLDRGLEMIESTENQNFDFDRDGMPDLDLSNYYNPVDNNSEEFKEELDKIPIDNSELSIQKTADQIIEEKPIEKKEQEVLIKNPQMELDGQQKPKTYEKPQNELKEKTANISDKSISGVEGVQMGIAGLALAMLLMGKS